jgi:hypothetical protein
MSVLRGWWAQDLGRARLPLLILSVSDGQGGLLRECSHPRGAVVVLPSECEEGWVLRCFALRSISFGCQRSPGHGPREACSSPCISLLSISEEA